MSHFSVMVIGANVDGQLALYNENITVEKYIKYTKEEAIEKERISIENYKDGVYAEYISNPDNYAKRHPNTAHLQYLSTEFPKKLEFTDEELYQEAIKYIETENIGSDSTIYSTYNPYSKWDWWVIGGRWRDMLKANGNKGKTLDKHVGTLYNKSRNGMCDQAFRKDIENWDEISTFAILFHGQWIERGEMGWWGIVINENSEEEWMKVVEEYKAKVKLTDLVTIVDCHI